MAGKQDNFFVSNRSKRGVLLLLLIILLISFTPRFLIYLKGKNEYVLTSEQLDRLEEQKTNFANKRTKKNRKEYAKKKFKAPSAKFDPNDYSKEEWMKLGLSQKQAEVVLKFTRYGIYSNEQLKKIVVIPESLYNLIKDSTYYPEKSVKYIPALDSKKRIRPKVELNNATTEDLETIPGIGSFYASNIAKYRDQLGGFFKKEQLMEVWKLDIDKYSAIEEFVSVDGTKVQKLNINVADVNELKTHPYISWKVANSIVKMRQQKGEYKSLNEIKESVLIDQELFDKLIPYLSL